MRSADLIPTRNHQSRNVSHYQTDVKCPLETKKASKAKKDRDGGHEKSLTAPQAPKICTGEAENANGENGPPSTTISSLKASAY